MRIYKFDIVVTCACAGLLGFFGWHAFYGQRGFDYREKLALESVKLGNDLSVVEKQRSHFEHRVSLLRPESIDPDMLDEMARMTLDVAASNELIVVPAP
jgi:cell division protein FtsB